MLGFNRRYVLEAVAANIFFILSFWNAASKSAERIKSKADYSKKKEAKDRKVLLLPREEMMSSFEGSCDFNTSFFVKMGEEKVFTSSRRRRQITGEITTNA